MDKFIAKRRKVEDGVRLNSNIEKEDDPVERTSVVSKVEQKHKLPTPILQYLQYFLSKYLASLLKL